jgi:hypothetical protein
MDFYNNMYYHQLVHCIEVQCYHTVFQYSVRVGGNACCCFIILIVIICEFELIELTHFQLLMKLEFHVG